MKRLVTSLILLAGWPVAAHADVVVTGTEQPGSRGPASEPSPRTVFISPRGIRMDEGKQSHVVDASNKTLLELDHARKTVRRMTFKQLGEKLKGARQEADNAVADARNRMAELPPGVRVKVEEAIRAQRSAMEARKPGAYKREPTGTRRTVNGFACEDVKELLNGEWVGSACVHKGVKLPEADRKMLQKLSSDMQAEGLSGGGTDELTRAFLDGIPVEMSVRHPVTHELSVEESVQKIELKPVDTALFDAPKDYRELPWDAPERRGPPLPARPR